MTTTEAPPDTTTRPSTLASVAASLDVEREAILAIQREASADERETAEALAQRSAGRSEQIKVHQERAAGLIAEHQRLMGAFSGLFAPAPGSKPPRAGTPRRRSAPLSGARKTDTDNIRAHAKERKLEGYGRPGRIPAAHVEDFVHHGGALLDPEHWKAQAASGQG